MNVKTAKINQRCAHSQNGQDLDSCCYVLQICARTRSPDIHQRDNADHQKRYEFCGPGTEWINLAQIIAEGNGQSSDRAGAHDKEKNPPEQECREAPEAIPYVDI